MLADERVETALRDGPPEEVTMPEISTGHCHPLAVRLDDGLGGILGDAVMTSAMKHAENAVKARKDLAAVKDVASTCIIEMMELIKAMYVFGTFGDLEVNGKPLNEIVPALLATQSAAGIAELFRTPTPVARIT
jgi:hypothetical protein